MKLSKKKIRQIIKEEIQKVVSEQEETNVIVDKAQKAASEEAFDLFQKIKKTSDESRGAVSLDMLINIITQELEKLRPQT